MSLQVRSNEKISADHLLELLHEKGFTKDQTTRIFKASTGAKEYQIMLMHILYKIKTGEVKEGDTEAATVAVIETYKQLRAANYPD